MSELIRLLLVEDNEQDAILLAHGLRKANFELDMERVQTAQEMQDALATKDWDVVISDYNLPFFSAPHALEILRKSGKDLPFIIVSGTIGEETAVEIMRSGAHDYLMKGNLNRLVEVLRREIRDARGRAESRRAEIALRESEEQLRLLFERSTDAIFVVEKLSGRYLNANKAAEKMTGRTVEELKTLTVSDITSQGAENRLQQVSIAADPLDFDNIAYIRPDGTIRTTHLTALPINDKRIFEIAHDITEQIQAENALRDRAQELEVLYRTSLEINSQTDLLPLLQTIMERATSLLNAPMGGLYLLQPDGKTLELVVAHHLAGNLIGATIRLGEGVSGLVAQTGQTVTVDDYRIWPNRAEIYKTEPFRRVLGVPMRVKNQVIGTIIIVDDEITGPHSLEEIRLVSLFADQATIAVENARLLNAVQRELTERKQAEENLRSAQAFLDHVLKAIPLGVSVYNLITSKMEFDNSFNSSLHDMNMIEFNDLSNFERLSKIHPDDTQELAEFMKNLLTLADGEIRYSEYRLLNKDERTVWRWLKYLCSVFERDADGKITKILAVTEDITGRKFSEQAIQRQLKELATLYNIARVGIQVNTIDELVELVTQEVGNSFYPENFGILLLDEDKKILRSHPSYRGLMDGVPAIASLEKSVTGQVLTTGNPRRIANVQFEPNYVVVTADIRSELCVPIKTEEYTFGVINAESKQIDFFQVDDERLLLTIAGQMAIAIERLRLFNAERQRRHESDNLRQATAALSTSLDLDQVLEAILTSLKQVVPYDSASVFLMDGDRLRLMVVDGLENTDELLGKSFPADDALFQEVKTHRQPLILANASTDPRFMGWGETSHARGWMSVPLITRGEVIGYITLDSYKEATYNQESGTMAQAFAHQAAAAMENARLFKGIQSSLDELNQAYESTIEGWSRAMDLRDKETEGHTLRVTKMTMQLAEAMGIEGDQLIHIRRGALLHDIGKMGVPDRILLKPDILSDDELIIMRRHPQYAYDMLSQTAYLHTALDIPYCHHEHWDGKGYPRGLKDQQIPLAARLFAVVDVWDALTSDRPYRPAWTHKDTLKYIQELSGLQFDPEIVKKFVKLVETEKGFYFI